MLRCDGWLRVDGLFDQKLRHALRPNNFPDSLREHELDFAPADFLVQLHRGEKILSLSGIELDADWQADALEQIANAFKVPRRQARHTRGKFRSSDLSDGN